MSSRQEERRAIAVSGAPAMVYHGGNMPAPPGVHPGYSLQYAPPAPALPTMDTMARSPFNKDYDVEGRKSSATAAMVFHGPVVHPSHTASSNIPPQPVFYELHGQDAPREVDPKEQLYPMAPEDRSTGVMPLAPRLAHSVGLVVGAVVTGLVGAVLADGASVIKLRHPSEIPPITDPALVKDGLHNYRLDELLGDSYAVGLHHDVSGATWTEGYLGATVKEYVEELGLLQVIAAVPSVIATDGLKHPAYTLQCKSIMNAGLAAESFGIIAMVVGIIMTFYHLGALIGFNPLATINGKYQKIGKYLSSLIWLILAIGFLVVCCDALGVFYDTHSCDNPFIPTIKLSEHFHWEWAYPIANIGFFAALAAFVAQFYFVPATDNFAPTKKTGMFALLTLIAGVVLGVVASVAVAGGVGAFNAPPPIDESINPCEGQKPYHAGPGDKYFDNVDCMKNGLVAVLEQAGANVTRGYEGGMDAGQWRVPITTPYDQTDLCPVNVHWHLGAEHLSVGEFDERGTGPSGVDHHGERLGHRCHLYNEADPKFTTPFAWQHCKDMIVGETYEVHWPHSAAGACGTDWQYQTPFYDGVFCRDGVINILTPLNTFKKIGVQAQTFTIVNDEAYYNDNLINGMIVDESFGVDMTMYTGSTTGTSRDNDVCSRFAPITWQVDRKCHLISASSFDKMCEMMKMQKDDMSDDLHAHGARETVAHHLTADNQVFDP